MGKRILSGFKQISQESFSIKKLFKIIFRVWLVIGLIFFFYMILASVDYNNVIYIREPRIAIANISNFTINLTENSNISYKLIK